METTVEKQPKIYLSDRMKTVVVDTITYLYILLFIYTATGKFFTFKTFNTILSRSPLTGLYSEVIAWLVPLTEVAIAALLIVPATRRLGLKLSALLMLLFTSFLIYGILSRSTLPCHCGGVISTMTWKQHIWFNSSFIVLAICAVMIKKK